MTYSEYQAGDITPEQTLRALCSDLAEVESQIAPLEAERGRLKDRISLVLARAGGRAELAGFGKLTITAPSVTKSYDARRLDDLLVRLLADGYGPIVEQIAQCRRESQRSGGLRIEREREK